MAGSTDKPDMRDRLLNELCAGGADKDDFPNEELLGGEAEAECLVALPLTEDGGVSLMLWEEDEDDEEADVARL
nr:hypothetical protein BaRGS_001125 [Batillaria attramentaria]